MIPLSYTWVFKDTRTFTLLKMAREAKGTRGIYYRSSQNKYLQESRDTGVIFWWAVSSLWYSTGIQSQVLNTSEWVQSSYWWSSALSSQDGCQPGWCCNNRLYLFEVHKWHGFCGPPKQSSSFRGWSGNHTVLCCTVSTHTMNTSEKDKSSGLTRGSSISGILSFCP